MSAVVNVLKDSEDELVFGVKTKSAGSDKQISNICSSLSGISVEGEESVQFGDVFGREDRVFGCNVFCEDGLEFFLLDFLLGHDKS